MAILLERSGSRAVLEIEGKKIEIYFIGDNVWFMHLCRVKPDFTGPNGVNIIARNGNKLSFSCPHCGLSGNLVWRPGMPDRENLDMAIRQLVR